LDAIYEHFVRGFSERSFPGTDDERRIGLEMKFPFVDKEGRAAPFSAVSALWEHLQQHGWEPVRDWSSGNVVGARIPGEHNDTVASCETGYCKAEFSLAHVSNLHDIQRDVLRLRELLRPFCETHRVHFLGFGIQPLTPPSRHLLMKKSRSSVWEKVFKSNNHIPEQDGDDVHLFTINAATHVHVSVSQEEAIPLVNVLNGFAGAQIAVMANSKHLARRNRPRLQVCCREILGLVDAGGRQGRCA